MAEQNDENPKIINKTPKRRYLPENRRKYYLRNIEKKREKQREYYAKNKEHISGKTKENDYNKINGRPIKYVPTTYIDDEPTPPANVDLAIQAEFASSCSEHGPTLIDDSSTSQQQANRE